MTGATQVLMPEVRVPLHSDDNMTTAVVGTSFSATTVKRIREVPVLRIVADILLMLLCGLPSLIFKLFVTPHARGYHCNDASLQHPYYDNLLSTGVIAVSGFIIAAILIALCEFLRESGCCIRAVRPPGALDHPDVIYRVLGNDVHPVLVRFYKYFGYFCLGAGIGMCLVDISKYSTGRLRPHFFDICKPLPLDGVPCSANDVVPRYIVHYQCTGKGEATGETDVDPSRLKEVFLSFYSGHSSFSFFTAIYLVLYLQARACRPLFSPATLPVMQLALVVLALWSAILNYTKNKHHYSDVICGAVVGSLVALVVTIFLAKVFKQTHSSSSPVVHETALLPTVDKRQQY